MSSASNLATRKPLALVPRERWQLPAVMQVDQLVTDLGAGSYEAGAPRFLSLVAVAAVTDERLDQLLAAAVDPQTAGYTCGELAMAVGFRPGEVLKIVKDAALAVGQAKSLHVLAEQLPGVAADVASRAQVHYLPCRACGETGWVTPKPTKDEPTPAPEPCAACGQTGRVRVEADLERQKLVFEAARLLPRAGGTSIAIQQTTQVAAGAGGAALFTQLVRASAEVLHRAAAVPLHAESPAPAPEADTVEGDVVSSAPVDAPPAEET